MGWIIDEDGKRTHVQDMTEPNITERELEKLQYEFNDLKSIAWGTPYSIVMTSIFSIMEKTILNIQAFSNSINRCKDTLNEHQAKFNEINKTIKKQERRIKQLIESTPENVHIE